MKLTTAEQIATFLATEAMGFALAKNGDGKGWYYRPDAQQWECRVDDWKPTSDLNQAFMVLERLLGAGWTWEVSVRLVCLWSDISEQGNQRTVSENHDNTPFSIAHAICVALCRAHGAEMDLA